MELLRAHNWPVLPSKFKEHSPEGSAEYSPQYFKECCQEKNIENIVVKIAKSRECSPMKLKEDSPIKSKECSPSSPIKPRNISGSVIDTLVSLLSLSPGSAKKINTKNENPKTEENPNVQIPIVQIPIVHADIVNIVNKKEISGLPVFTKITPKQSIPVLRRITPNTNSTAVVTSVVAVAVNKIPEKKIIINNNSNNNENKNGKNNENNNENEKENEQDCGKENDIKNENKSVNVNLTDSSSPGKKKTFNIHISQLREITQNEHLKSHKKLFVCKEGGEEEFNGHYDPRVLDMNEI